MIASGWATSLGDHFLAEGDEPSLQIDVRYDDAPEALADARAYMDSNSVLELVADDIAQLVHDVEPFTLVGRSCNATRAFWSPSKREAVICYELTDWFIKNHPR
jgi:hypothetical protein